MTNAGGGMGRIAAAVAGAVLPKFAEAARQRMQPTGPPARAPFTAPPSELLGEWTGTLRTWERTVPMSIVFQPDGDVHVRLEGQLETLLDQVSWRENHLTGRFAGTI